MLEYAIAIGIPAVGVAFAIGRYFWKKEKCFIKMENAIKTLTVHDTGSNDTHDGFEERLDVIEKNQTKNFIYLKLLLDDAKIKYD